MSYNRDENFMGFNPINWYGVVEDRDDPLKLGRVKVRIIGWHNLDPLAAPVDLLPWAQIQLAPNSPRTFTGPRVNDLVNGYFIDGAGGQYPIVTGVIPGINLELKPVPEGAPVPPEGIVLEAEDTPSTPPLGAGVVENSLIAKTNSEIVHVCDITPQVKQVTDWIKVKFGYIANLIRDQIRALLKALGLDPTGETSAIVSFLKKIASYIKRITEILTDVQNWRDAVLEIAAKARAIIDWILNLPEKFLRLLSECLSNLYKAIAGGFQNILSMNDVTGTSDTSLSDAFNEITSASSILVKQATDLASTPAQLAGVLLSPSSSGNISAIQSYIANQTTSTAQYTDNNFSKNNTQTV